MSNSSTNGLLSALVDSIRQTCQQHIEFEDFTSISGLISFDVDGSKQQCFIINELVYKRGACEGDSAHLKTLKWKNLNIKKVPVWKTKEKFLCPEEALRQTTGDGPLCDQELQKCFGDPQDNFATNSKLDWSNRTFTLKTTETSSEDCPSPKSISPTKNISTSTITVSKKANDRENLKRSPRQCIKKGIYQSPVKENGYYIDRWPRRCYTSKTFAQSRNYYPGLPKKTKKKATPYLHEKLFSKQKIDSRSGMNLETSRKVEKFEETQSKVLYNSPSEKPTALSWFEEMLSPSSSVESINSIKPFYLVPHSEPLSLPQNCDKDSDITPNCLYQSEIPNCNYVNLFSKDIIQPTKTPRSFSQTGNNEEQPHDVLGPLVKWNSPLRTTAAHSTTSSGTLNTVSSIEPDALATVNEKSPERQASKLKDARENMSPPPVAYNVHSHTLNDYSNVSKKRASLLKWMGLFKKGPKASSTALSVPEMPRREKQDKSVAKVKQRGKSSAHSVLEPPIDIRLKQWN